MILASKAVAGRSVGKVYKCQSLIPWRHLNLRRYSVSSNSAGGTTRLSVTGNYSGSKPDVAIVVFGETPHAEGAGDLSNIEYQAGYKSDLAMLEEL